MDAWTLGLLEIAPVAVVAVIVWRHVRGVRRAAAVEEGPPAASAHPRAQGARRRD